MRQMTEQEQAARQRRAYENREDILPGDRISLRCIRAGAEAAFFQLESGELACCQEPGKELKAGDVLHLACTAAAIGENGYGPFVDYVFRARETGHTVIINGPDAQAAAPKRTARAVSNRDIPALTEVLSVMQAVGEIEQRRGWQRDRMSHITQIISGMPGGGSPKGLDAALAALDELDREQREECLLYVRQLRKAQAILNGIENLNMRTFVVMRYVMGCSDAEIRRELNLGRRGFERARRCVENARSMAAVKWQERFILDQTEDEGTGSTKK